MPAVLEAWVRKISWRTKWLSTPVFLPGEFHGQRNLVGYSPWGLKESDMTKQLILSHLFQDDNIIWQKGLCKYDYLEMGKLAWNIQVSMMMQLQFAYVEQIYKYVNRQG